MVISKHGDLRTFFLKALKCHGSVSIVLKVMSRGACSLTGAELTTSWKSRSAAQGSAE